MVIFDRTSSARMLCNTKSAWPMVVLPNCRKENMVDLVRNGTKSRDMTEVQCAIEVQVELTGQMLLL